MGDIFFVLKGFVITIVIALLLQVKLGQDTLEIRAHRWIHTSSAGQFLTDTAAGGVKAIRQTYQWTNSKLFGAESSRGLGNTQGNEESQIGPWKISTQHKVNSDQNNLNH